MPESDRRLLIQRNTSLFIQYFLGRFFFAGTGYKQHQWLLLSQVPEYLSDGSYLRFIPITTFDGLVGLFKSKRALKKYEGYAKRLHEVGLQVHCNSIVGYCVLFDHAPGMGLQAEAAVEAARAWAYESAGFASDK